MKKVKIKPPKKSPEILLYLADAAVYWWATNRPITWSLEKHLQNPSINTATEAETMLSIAVADWCRIQKCK